MKRLVLVAVNSQYSHTNLAVRYLAAVCKDVANTTVFEFNINQPKFTPFKQILSCKPDYLGLSCYIWNINYVLSLASDIKAASPDTVIILGGPEVSFRANEIYEKYSFIDYIVCGEAETSFPRLIRALDEGKAEKPSHKYDIITDISEIPSPYENTSSESFENKLVYYESSRGCPFSCTYCLSGSITKCNQNVKKIRELPLDRVCREVSELAEKGVKILKLVDRTFNANKKRAEALMEFFSANTGDMCIHLEVAADLLTPRMMDILCSSPKGKFQLEAGIQSFNENTLRAVDRVTDLEAIRGNIRRLVDAGVTHIHIDLIAGLPLEDYSSFASSFNEAYALHPDMLQLGFLKVLPGSAIKSDCDKYGIRYRKDAPYEVIYTDHITVDELIKLKCIEAALDIYYNKERNRKYVETALRISRLEPFVFYEKLSQYLDEHGLIDRPMSGINQYKAIYSFVCEAYGSSRAEELPPPPKPK